MTDNEIIKALECCVESECEGCKYEYDTACKEYILHDCIRLIKQKQDEVKAYKHYYDECLKDLKKANTENERLQGAIDMYEEERKYHFEMSRQRIAEAIKEFAERLKSTNLYEFIEEYYENAELCYEVRQDQFEEYCDNLVKEMVGDHND